MGFSWYEILSPFCSTKPKQIFLVNEKKNDKLFGGHSSASSFCVYTTEQKWMDAISSKNLFTLICNLSLKQEQMLWLNYSRWSVFPKKSCAAMTAAISKDENVIFFLGINLLLGRQKKWALTLVYNVGGAHKNSCAVKWSISRRKMTDRTLK